jgi:ferric-dicitrate binding protein FerR (iron transport regulator)
MNGRDACEAHRKLLESHLAGGLDPGSEPLLEAHERACPECAAERQAYARVVDRLNALREAREADPAFEEAAAQLRRDPAPAVRPRRAPAPRRTSSPRGAAALAAACLAAAAVVYYVASQTPPESPPGQARTSEPPGPAEAPGPDPGAPPPPAVVEEQRKLIEALGQAAAIPAPPAPQAERRKPAEAPAPKPPAAEAQDATAPPSIPAEKPALPAARAREAVSWLAHFEYVKGTVLATADGVSAKPEVGGALPAGHRVETRGRDSAAVLLSDDGTRIALGPDSAVSGSGPEGKAVFVNRGVVTVSVPRRGLGTPASLATARARVEVLEGRATLSVAGESTRVDVAEGRARLVRISDGASADVRAGHYAVVAPRLALQEKPQEKAARVDQEKVDAAIRKGIEYLKRRATWGAERAARKDELVLLTYVHADVPAGDPAFQKLFNAMLEAPLERTYSVALQAMILEEVQRVKHQVRIAQCAQFLLDNLCRNGQWSYGEPTVFSLEVPRVVASGSREAREFLDPGEKPKVVRRIPVKKQREGPESGDNSNTQYAALGLRACHDAGIVFPKEWVRLARQWWYASQHDPGDGKDPYAGRGWSYRQKGDFHPYGSMTAGAIGGLVIYDHMLEEPWKTDRAVIRGMEWMARQFTVTENPGPPEPHGGGLNHYYYLYAVERLGILYGTETLGAHEWYPKGAQYLLGAQKGDGSWEADDPVTDTCFAILFLRRATRPIATPGRAPK